MKQNIKINILGNHISCLPSYSSFYQIIKTRASGVNTSSYVTVNNVHTIMEGFRNKEYQHIINNSYLAIPDGKPLSIVGKLKGNQTITRLFGPTVMEHFIDWGRKDGLTHFFIGSSESTLKKLQLAIDANYPGTKVVGMISPPYQPMHEWDNEHYLRMINDAAPDFIWVGLGAPKQERWMFEHYRKASKGLFFGIGAGFDYLAGNTTHAPEWMKNASLEWLYRLVQEPKRLWKRYLTTIAPFIVLASLELLREKLKAR